MIECTARQCVYLSFWTSFRHSFQPICLSVSLSSFSQTTGESHFGLFCGTRHVSLSFQLSEVQHKHQAAQCKQPLDRSPQLSCVRWLMVCTHVAFESSSHAVDTVDRWESTRKCLLWHQMLFFTLKRRIWAWARIYLSTVSKISEHLLTIVLYRTRCSVKVSLPLSLSCPSIHRILVYRVMNEFRYEQPARHRHCHLHWSSRQPITSRSASTRCRCWLQHNYWFSYCSIRTWRDTDRHSSDCTTHQHQCQCDHCHDQITYWHSSGRTNHFAKRQHSDQLPSHTFAREQHSNSDVQDKRWPSTTECYSISDCMLHTINCSNSCLHWHTNRHANGHHCVHWNWNWSTNNIDHQHNNVRRSDRYFIY